MTTVGLRNDEFVLRNNQLQYFVMLYIRVLCGTIGQRNLYTRTRTHTHNCMNAQLSAHSLPTVCVCSSLSPLSHVSPSPSHSPIGNALINGIFLHIQTRTPKKRFVRNCKNGISFVFLIITVCQECDHRRAGRAATYLGPAAHRCPVQFVQVHCAGKITRG